MPFFSLADSCKQRVIGNCGEDALRHSNRRSKSDEQFKSMSKYIYYFWFSIGYRALNIFFELTTPACMSWCVSLKEPSCPEERTDLAESMGSSYFKQGLSIYNTFDPNHLAGHYL